MTVRVYGPRDKCPEGHVSVNTTSSSKNWSRGLSPFYLRGITLYGGHTARNMENAWQYAKVFPKHLDQDGNPSEAYWEWATWGWNKSWADRYPMGKGAAPAYTWWDGEKLGYVEARKKVYVPLYSEAVRKTEAFQTLSKMHADGVPIALFDYDGYDHVELGMTLQDVVDDPTRKMGHAFVLAALLEKIDLTK